MRTPLSQRTCSRCFVVVSVLTSVLLVGQTLPRNDHLVTVDVVATDSSGQPVAGLLQQDFQIFENKHPQRIRAFKAHQLQLTPNSFPSNLPHNSFTNIGSEADEKPITVILLDQMNTSIYEQELARREVIKYLQQNPDGASFAIVTIRNDTVACQDKGIASWTITSTPDRSWDVACSSRGKLIFVQGVTDNSEQLLAAMNSELAQPHSTFYRTKLANALSPASAPKHSSLLIRFFGGPMPSPLFSDSYRDQGSPGEVTDTSMTAMAELGSFLDGLPGRKNLVWLAGDFDAGPIPQDTDHLFVGKFKGWQKADPFSPIDMDHLASDRLGLARVAIYPVDLTGKNKDIQIRHYSFAEDSFFGAGYWSAAPLPVASFNFGVDINHGIKVDAIARYSGGRAFHGSDSVQAALEQAVADNDTYYALTYSPADLKFNSKDRQLRVAVDRLGVRLTYRRRYFADNPGTVVAPDPTAVTDVNVLNPTPGPLGTPWKVLRVPYTPPTDASDPIEPAMRYGTAGLHNLLFTAHLRLAHKPEAASAEQMAGFAQYDSYLPERVAQEAEDPTKEEEKTRHKRHTPLHTFAPLAPEVLDPYEIRYVISGNQLSSGVKNGTLSVDLEVALVAYDAMGHRVTGLKTQAKGMLSRTETASVLKSGFQIEQKIDIPERATTIRVAVRNASDNQMGSLEIPLWAVSSPYKRKQLPFPTELSDAGQKQR